VDERELVGGADGLARKATWSAPWADPARPDTRQVRLRPVKRLVAANPEAPGLAKQELDVTVPFVDISGYSRLAERVPR